MRKTWEYIRRHVPSNTTSVSETENEMTRLEFLEFLNGLNRYAEGAPVVYVYWDTWAA